MPVPAQSAAAVFNLSLIHIYSLDGFIYPSFVEAFLGPNLFDLGYGPFRWVCLSGRDEVLHKTDLAAMECIEKDRRYQDYDNYIWIRDAEKNCLL